MTELPKVADPAQVSSAGAAALAAALAAVERLDVKGLRERMERETAEAAFVLAGVRELQLFRGRMSKVTVGDIAAVLGAARNLRTDALLAATDVVADTERETV